MPQQQTFTDVQPIQQSFSDVQPVAGDVADRSSPAYWDALKDKYELPRNYDLSKTLLENYASNDKLKKGELNGINLDKLSAAWQEANPQSPTPISFLGRSWDEAKNVLKGLFGESAIFGNPMTTTSVAGTRAPENPIPTIRSRAQELIEHPAAGVGALATDAAMATVPFFADELLPGTGRVRTSLAEIVRDPATGRIKTPYELAMERVLPDPYAPKATPAQSIPKGTNYGQYLRDQAMAARQASKEAAAAAKQTAQESKAVPITQSPNFNPVEYKAGQVQRFGNPEQTTIKRPALSGGPATFSEGRPATWTNETVRELASWGDPDAVEQARLRGFGRIPLKFEATQLNPKSVTTFTPEGTPVEQGASAAQTPTASNRPQYTYKPSEKAATMSEKARDYGPEFNLQQWQEEINRSTAILRNPSATPEERAIAQARLDEARRQSGTRP